MSRTWRACAARPAARSSSSRRLERLEVGGERNLRVDDDVLPAGNADDEVGAEEIAVAVARRRLGDEVAVLEHPRELDDVPELRLAPAAAHGRRAERVREAAGALAEQRDLLAKRPVGVLARPVELLHAEPDLLQRLPAAARRSSRAAPGRRRGTGSRCRGTPPPTRSGPPRRGVASNDALGGLETRRRPRELALELEHSLAPRARRSASAGRRRSRTPPAPTTRPMRRATIVMRARDRSARGRTEPGEAAAILPGPCRRSRVRTASAEAEVRPARAATAATLLLLGARRRRGRSSIAAVALAFTLGGGSAGGDARAALEAAGCTLSATPALRGDHSVTTPTGTSKKWNTVPRRAARTTRCPSSTGSTTSPSTRRSSSTTSSTARSAIQYGDGRPAGDGRRSCGRSRRATHAARSSRRYPALGDKIALGAWVDRRAPRADEGHRVPREVHGRSTRRRSRRSSTRTSSKGPSGSRRTRCCPAAPRRRSRTAPGWRNWSDAAGLKPAVLRDIGVRLPAPALPGSVPPAGRA